MNNKDKHLILVVDDEAAYIDVFRDILTPAYAVKPAINGNLALKMAEKYNPDLILLDVIMPDISGFNVLTALKESISTKDIPVILVSGLSESKDEVKGLRLGAADYIKKPFDNDIVELRVKMHLKILEQARTLERMGLAESEQL